MNPQAQALADFRSQVTRLLQERDVEWENSRKLVGAGRLPETLRHLIEEVRRVDLPPSICEAILTALNFGHVERVQDLPGPRLKELTGLPPTKAVRALCVWFDLAGASESPAAASSLPATVLEAAIQDEASPFDVLLAADAPSLLDLGAGDLSFASEVADRYAAPVRAQGKTLVLHGVDRLQPQSKLGGPLHPDRLTLDRLRSRPDLSFQFFPARTCSPWTVWTTPENSSPATRSSPAGRRQPHLRVRARTSRPGRDHHGTATHQGALSSDRL